jgi:hypothetical protein
MQPYGPLYYITLCCRVESRRGGRRSGEKELLAAGRTFPPAGPTHIRR